MSLFDFFKSQPKVSDNQKRALNLIFNSTPIERMQKIAIIYMIQNANSGRPESNNSICKRNHDLFFKTTISIAGLDYANYNQSILLFNIDGLILNNMIHAMTLEQKINIILLYIVLAEFCEEMNEDVTIFWTSMQVFSKLIDPKIDLVELAKKKIDLLLKL